MRGARSSCLVAGTWPAVATLLCIVCYAQSLASSKEQAQSNATKVGEWSSYGGDPGGSRFSPLTQINRTNVQHLKIAWIYRTADVSDGTTHPRRSGFEATPIMVDGTQYFSTAFNRVIALDPETGAERWSYDPGIDLNRGYSEGLINRGVSTWADSRPGSLYARRIFIATIDARLICLDAAVGKPCADFGAGGQINLRQGIKNIIREGEYEETSPPAIIDGLVIVGSSVADNDRVESPNGLVRAFDLPGRRGPQQTGQLPLAMPHPVAQVCAEWNAASEIVIPFHLLAPAAALPLAFHQHQFQGLAFANGAFHQLRFRARSRNVCPPRTPPAQLPQIGELQEAFGLEPLQQLPALVVLQPSTGSLPVQQLADGTRDLGHPQGGKLQRGLAHQLQFAGTERASAKGEGFRHAVDHGAVQPALGTMSRITLRGARNSLTQREKASWSCCQQVRNRLARI